MTRLRVHWTVMLTLLFALACALPAIPMDDASFNTAVAQTVMVGLTEKYVSPTFTASATTTFTPTLTWTPEPPTLTSAPTETVPPTLSFTPTATVAIPPSKLIVTVNTNCRTGPDKSFRVEGTLLKGETTTVHGVDPSGQYWYIRNPDPGVEYCWISGRYATVSGAIPLLPIMTALPTPTVSPTATPVPNFNLFFSKIETCGVWWVDMKLVNNGGMEFKSVLIKVKEPFKGQTLITGGNEFVNLDGCNTNRIVEDSLLPGREVTVSTPSIEKDITGKKLIVTVSACTELNGNGICITKTLTFKPE